MNEDVQMLVEAYKHLTNKRSRLEAALNSGADVFLNTWLDRIGFTVIVFNDKTKGKSPRKSIMTSAAFEALETFFKDPNISGEGDTLHDELVGSFWEDEAWERLTPVYQGIKLDVVVDHNGKII